jgi:sugar (pentulose or hexulose) kinase
MVGQLDAGGRFDPNKLEKISSHLAKRMPKVGQAGEVLGKLNARGAELLGLPHGIPVAFPEGDQPVGMVASGCVLPGQASISLGNSVVFNAVGTAPILTERGVVDSFRTATGDHLLMTCLTSGCIVYDELVDCFAALWKGSKDELRDWLTQEAAQVPPGCDGAIALPFYLGEGVFRQPDAFASLVGLRKGQLRAGVLARASMEAVSLVMRYGYDRMQLGGLREIVLSGGGSKNALWPQIIADVFGVRVRKPQDAHEAATRGAAYLALYMARREAGQSETLDQLLAERVQLSEPIRPDPARTQLYQEMLPAFEDTLQQLTPLYDHPWYRPRRS